MAKEQYVASGGINAVRRNDRIGPIPAGGPDDRGRFDTVGSTVYYGETALVALAESLQQFRRERLALEVDADAVGMSVDEFADLVERQARENGLDPPWRVGLDWQMSRCIHEVVMPAQGFWVDVHGPHTLNALALDLAPRLKRNGLDFLTIGDLMAENRAVTTMIAQYIRDAVLFDGSLPLGVRFNSKTGYGACYAWWNRRADDGLVPGHHDPRTVNDLNIAIPELETICADWNLTS